MPLRTLEQAAHVRTANRIGAVQYDQLKMIERFRPIYRCVDQQMHTVLAARDLDTDFITAEVMIERNDRWLVVPEQRAELCGVTRHQPVARRWRALVVKEDFGIDGKCVCHARS